MTEENLVLTIDQLIAKYVGVGMSVSYVSLHVARDTETERKLVVSLQDLSRTTRIVDLSDKMPAKEFSEVHATLMEYARNRVDLVDMEVIREGSRIGHQVPLVLLTQTSYTTLVAGSVTHGYVPQRKWENEVSLRLEFRQAALHYSFAFVCRGDSISELVNEEAFHCIIATQREAQGVPPGSRIVVYLRPSLEIPTQHLP